MDRLQFYSAWLLTLPILAAAPLSAQEKPKKARLPLTAKLVAKTKTYKLDLGGKTQKEFVAFLENAEKGKNRAPTPPEVNLVLVLKNTSKQPVQFWHTGDPVRLQLKVKGPGAIKLRPRLAFTADFRIPKATTVQPGKTYSIPIKRLRFGFRGASEYAYWTKPGAYSIAAVLKTGINPAPKGVKARGGFGRVEIESTPAKVNVTK